MEKRMIAACFYLWHASCSIIGNSSSLLSFLAGSATVVEPVFFVAWPLLSKKIQTQQTVAATTP
jgi:hypothetical protein